jgi:putative transposase
MPRLPRELKDQYCYHITTRCNNREFRLTKDECREVLLFAIEKCKENQSKGGEYAAGVLL